MQIHIVGTAAVQRPNSNFYDFFPYRNVAGTPRLMVTNVDALDVGNNTIATATAGQAGNGVFCATSEFSNDAEILHVSGLTYCVGLFVLRFEKGKLVRGVVAHFNGHWHLDSAWKKIGKYAHESPNTGTLYAIIVLTSDSTTWDREKVQDEFGQRLESMGVRSANTLLYHSNTWGLAFMVRRDGLLGEPVDKDPFNTAVQAHASKKLW